MNPTKSFKARISCQGKHVNFFPTCCTDSTCRSAAHTLDNMLAIGAPLGKQPGMEIRFESTPSGYQLSLVDDERLGNDSLAFEHGYLGAFIRGRKPAATFLLQPMPQLETGGVFQAQLLSVGDNKPVGLKPREADYIYRVAEIGKQIRDCPSLEGTAPVLFEFHISEVSA